MLRNFLSGVGVGIANIIPGISGGTILVILGLFDKFMHEIANIFDTKSKFKDKVKSGVFILQVLVGVGVGLVCFAKLLNYLFVHFELQTISLFAGFIILSLPSLKKEEMKNKNINYVYFCIGIILIAALAIFSPGENGNIVSLNELLAKDLNIIYLLSLVLLGAISGATMIFPGISGSMVLLVLGWYHLFKGYVANVTTIDLKIYIPILFIGIGVLIGVIGSAKLVSSLLKKHKDNTMSFIFGLILASAIVIFPTNIKIYTKINILTSIITFILGGLIVVGLDKLKDKKKIR